MYFPVRLESKLKWSPTLYDKLPNGTVVVRKKIFSELVVVALVKKRYVKNFLLNLQSFMVKSFVNFCGLVTFLYLNSSNLRPVKSFVDVVGF